MYYRLEISPDSDRFDARGSATASQARSFLHLPVETIRTRDVYSFFIDCGEEQAQEILSAFTNPIIQNGRLGETRDQQVFDWLVIVGFRPGVTDNVARSARSAVSDILERRLRDDEEIYTAIEYFVTGKELDRDAIGRLAAGLLANDLIQTTAILSFAEWQQHGVPVNRPAVTERTTPEVNVIDLDVSDDELMRISREGVLALSLEEMKAIQAYFQRWSSDRIAVGLPANPTDVELECIAQTWSEHCKHKIFNAWIEYTDEDGLTKVIDSCFKSFIKRSTDEIATHVSWLRSVFHDNAGVICFNDRLDLAYKVETHNSPTALDPYGGAITGIVGVNRDPLGTGKGADLLLNVWGYCFASPFTAAEEVPAGLFHPRRLRDQVHKGVIDGGNQSGIPYAVGWEYFDPRYLGKPLVYCGTVGLMPHTLHGEPGHAKSIEPGDLAVMIGGRIGKDGIHGATFSSEELHKDSPVQAVQIGDPITQRLVKDFLIEARDAGLYRFVTDNGAGGLSSSLGEMSQICGGCEIELAEAPLKYEGLQPWEILLSEAQERMSLAVPEENIEAFLALARRRDVEATVLGRFTDSGKFHVKYNGGTVAFLDEEFLHDGLPQIRLKARWQPPRHDEPVLPATNEGLADELVQIMSRLNICSGEYKARQYDHEVKGLSVVKPYLGVNGNVASDAAVAMVEPCSREGVILAAGIAPRYSDIDTYHMMASVIDMAVRRTIAVGGQLGTIAGLDNFCWPDPVEGPNNPDGAYKAAQLVRANQALYDYTTAYGVPCISGKDSMKNDSTMGGRRISIPPTVLFSTIARMEDISKAVTLDAKRDGDLVYVIGETSAELGGSEYLAMLGYTGNRVPRVDAATALKTYERISTATRKEFCHSLHTPALGGLAAALARIAIGGHRGLDIDLSRVPTTTDMSLRELLFSESNSRFVATVGKHDRQRFEALMAGVPFACVGKVMLDPVMVFRQGEAEVVRVHIDRVSEAYTKTLDGI
jgi:phosphoribosylformylglycinamidine synthase II